MGNCGLAWLHATADPLTFLTIVDWMVADCRTGIASSDASTILTSGNSAWTVGEGATGTQASSTSRPNHSNRSRRGHLCQDTASHHLAESWQAAFGLNGNPSSAYSHAIKAVEFAANPSRQPNNTKATLGTVISQVRQDGDWIIPLTREKATGYVAEMLLSML